jgi:solute carrier family 30 (zinc transporter), member 2
MNVRAAVVHIMGDMV